MELMAEGVLGGVLSSSGFCSGLQAVSAFTNEGRATSEQPSDLEGVGTSVAVLFVLRDMWKCVKFPHPNRVVSLPPSAGQLLSVGNDICCCTPQVQIPSQHVLVA